MRRKNDDIANRIKLYNIVEKNKWKTIMNKNT